MFHVWTNQFSCSCTNLPSLFPGELQVEWYNNNITTMHNHKLFNIKTVLTEAYVIHVCPKPSDIRHANKVHVHVHVLGRAKRSPIYMYMYIRTHVYKRLHFRVSWLSYVVCNNHTCSVSVLWWWWFASVASYPDCSLYINTQQSRVSVQHLNERCTWWRQTRVVEVLQCQSVHSRHRTIHPGWRNSAHALVRSHTNS